jgi:hypothetical protein
LGAYQLSEIRVSARRPSASSSKMTLSLSSFIFWTESNWFVISKKIEPGLIERHYLLPRMMCHGLKQLQWLLWQQDPSLSSKIQESTGNPTQLLQDKVKQFRQVAKYSCRRDEGHLCDLANRRKSHHFKCPRNCILCNRETLIFHFIFGFWFILQNDIVPYLLCYARVCDGIRAEYLHKFGGDIIGFGRKTLQVEKHDNWLLIQTA